MGRRGAVGTVTNVFTEAGVFDRMSPTSRLPRGLRVPVLLVVALAMVTAGGWALSVHDPAPTTPDRPAFLSAPGEPLPAPAENRSYRVTARSSTQTGLDEATVVRTRQYVPGQRAVVVDSQVVTGDDDVVQSTTYRRGDRQFVRRTFSDADAFRQAIERGPVARLDETSLTAYSVERRTNPPASIRPGEALDELYALRYERVGETIYRGERVVEYEPTAGWATRARLDADADAESVYVRQAEGQVLVDPDDGAILVADVEGAVVRADDWAGVLTGDARSLAVEYRVETDVDRPTRPAWVASFGRNTSTGR